MKFSFYIIFCFLSNFLFSQTYYFPGTISQDSIKVENRLKEIVTLQNQKYFAKSDLDSLNNLVKQEIFLEQYNKALNNISKYREHCTINNWEGNKLFSFEVYCKAKLLAKTENITFKDALEKSIKNLIEKLSENLLIKLKTDELSKVVIYQKDKLLISYSKKDSIGNDQVTSLINSIVDYRVITNVNQKALSIWNTRISEKFSIERSDIKISDAILTITTFRRKNQTKPCPAILYNNIYAGDRDYMLGLRAAIRDYVGVVVNVRGKRNSPDLIEPFEHEAEDLYEVIDWISKQLWCNRKVAMTGGSYLGFSQWGALKKKIHPALKTIVPQVAVGIGTMDYPMINNVFMNYMLPWLRLVTNNKLEDFKDFDNDDQWVNVYNKYYLEGKKFKDLDSICGKRNLIFQRWLEHPCQDSYWQKMAPFKNDFSKINIPILTTTGFFDADQRGALYYFNEHYKFNKKAEHYLLMGPYDHAMGQSYGWNEVEGHKLDDEAKINIINVCYDWFDYILKGKTKPVILKNKVNIQIMGTNKWKHFNSMNQTSSSKLKFYLNTNKGTNSVFAKPNSETYYSQKVDLKIRNENDKYYSTGKDSTEIKSNKIVVESEILQEDIIINGAFTGNLKLAINKKDIDLRIELIQVTPEGKIIDLSEYIGRASYARDNSKRQLLKPNQLESIPIHNSMFIGKKIEKGSKLVVIYGLNKSMYWQINYGTGKDVSDESIDDAKEPFEIKWYNDSYIEIPVLKE